MGTEKLLEKIAVKVYDILEEIGAPSNMKEHFVYVQGHEAINEWRFQGLLGFGGKFWNEWSYMNNKFEWRVSCYSEDENPKRLGMINHTNKKLKKLADEISKSKGNTDRV